MPETPSIAIRPVEPCDDRAIAALLNPFIRDSHIHFGVREQSPEEVGAERQGRHPSHPWLVAERAGEFAGLARAHAWRARAAYARTVEVAVYVEPHHRRHGVARALYQRLFHELRAHDIHTCVAGIALPNDASIQLHASLGFERVGTFREVGRKFDAWHDVLFMQRPVP